MEINEDWLNCNPALDVIGAVTRCDDSHREALAGINTKAERAHYYVALISSLTTRIGGLAEKARQDPTALDEETIGLIRQFRVEWEELVSVFPPEHRNIVESLNPFPDSFSLEGKFSLSDLQTCLARLEFFPTRLQHHLSNLGQDMRELAHTHEMVGLIVLALGSKITGASSTIVHNMRVR
jgi:hypothetical protein